MPPFAYQPNEDPTVLLMRRLEQQLESERLAALSPDAWYATLQSEVRETLAVTFGGGYEEAEREITNALRLHREREAQQQRLEELALMTRFLVESGEVGSLRHEIRELRRDDSSGETPSFFTAGQSPD